MDGYEQCRYDSGDDLMREGTTGDGLGLQMLRTQANSRALHPSRWQNARLQVACAWPGSERVRYGRSGVGGCEEGDDDTVMKRQSTSAAGVKV